MKKSVLSLLLFSICLLLLPNTIGFAQGLKTGPVYVPVVDETSFTFVQLREEEIRMFGPFSTETILFGLPANWKLLEGAQLELNMTITIQDAISSAEAGSSIYGGTLTVTVNGIPVAVLPLNQSGSITQVIAIPTDILIPIREDGRVELAFLLSSSQACLVDQKMDIVIHSSSRFTIPHEVIQPDTNLANFPRPLYQDSIFVDSARIVIPDQPTAAELQSALTVAAGLQARTGNSMLIDVINSSGLTPENMAESHLIMVGNAGSLPSLYELLLPLGVSDGQFPGAGESGVLQMISSPWSPDRVVLVVSGNSDKATIKAAQALSTGVIRPNNVTNLALIDDVNGRVYINESSVDQTLGGLGYESATFEGRGENTETYQFYIPTGQTVTAEAYFEISMSNSMLLNYTRSGLFVVLNDKPIGSIRLSDETANKPNNRVRIAIPPSAVRPGLNYLDVTAVLEPLEECADPNQAGLFVTLWSDSRLYLPLGPAPINTIDTPDLGGYPIPFVQVPELSQIAFILQRDNFESWRYAIQLAADLGAISDGVIFTPTVFYADDVPEAARSIYNMLVVGFPSKMKFVDEINDRLPAPFPAGSDTASESELQVVYQIDPKMPAGYLELLPSPWNPENLIITILGNSPQGVSWAAGTLLDEAARPKLIGNFAVVTGEQVISIDTRLFVNANESVALPPVTVSPDVVDVEAAAPITKAGSSTSVLVLTALFVTVFLIFVVIGIAVYTNRKRK